MEVEIATLSGKYEREKLLFSLKGLVPMPFLAKYLYEELVVVVIRLGLGLRILLVVQLVPINRVGIWTWFHP